MLWLCCWHGGGKNTGNESGSKIIDNLSEITDNNKIDKNEAGIQLIDNSDAPKHTEVYLELDTCFDLEGFNKIFTHLYLEWHWSGMNCNNIDC